MSTNLDQFREIWCVDFEFKSDSGELPEVHCVVAREFRSGQTLKLWVDELGPTPPFAIGPDALFVAYFATAELGCFLQLGWRMPERILDLYVEFRNHTNGWYLPDGKGLLGALAYYGLDRMAGAEKDELRQLAIRGGPFTAEEKSALLDYCETDVVALAKLLPAMLPGIDLRHAVMRGRFMAAVARMERTGTPIDTQRLRLFRSNWDLIKSQLIDRVDSRYGVYDNGVFKRDRFGAWLQRNGIAWPRLESGQLALDRDTFRDRAKAHPEVSPLRELRNTMGELRLESLAVGRDGRNRTMLSPFSSKTGRNQPSNSRFIFGPSCWLRSLIKPEPGRAVAYVDWSQQEFAIAAQLSGDKAMMEAYSSGDPYLAFARQAGAVPRDATRQSHPQEREQFKVCSLAVQYGMGAKALSVKLDKAEIYGQHLLAAHRRTYPDFWRWSDGCVDHAMLNNELQTTLGWKLHVPTNPNPRSLANFPVQGNGAEMLRVACCLATERDINVCAPVHDAILVEGPSDSIEEIVAETQASMAQAGRIILGGFDLLTDAEIVRWPDRYRDPRGRVLWAEVCSICENGQAAHV